MELSIISFTTGGRMLSENLEKSLNAEFELHLYCKCKKYRQEYKKIKYCHESLEEWTGVQFERGRAVLFIGACGIAVRSIAPHLKDKLKDIPVLVMDEMGTYIIPILSGHYGGANEICRTIAKYTGAISVITTATDVNGVFAVDVFAKKNHLVIVDKEGVKKIASSILGGEEVTVFVEGQFKEALPKELKIVKRDCEASLIISPYKKQGTDPVLQLYPRVFVLGIGCRRGKSEAEIKSAVEKHLKSLCIPMEAVALIASAKLKQEEEGLCAFAEHCRIPFETFDVKTLKEVPGNYTASIFVKSHTGVDNVCERAAMAACRRHADADLEECSIQGRLILKKQAENGITLAIAQREWRVSFL